MGGNHSTQVSVDRFGQRGGHAEAAEALPGLAPECGTWLAIAPGAFATDMNVLARDNPEIIADYVPASRVGRPEDIAGTAVYMASRAGDYLVGITLAVDRGVTHAL